MIKYYLVLFMLTMCYGKIEIIIKTSNFLNETIIKHNGSDVKPVTKKEVLLFNVTNDNLKHGVRNDLGKAPDEVFLKDPTDYGDIFKKYKWPDVRRKLSVKNITIVELVKQDILLEAEVFMNNETAIFKSKTDVTVPVNNTLSTVWNKKRLPEDDIDYNIEIDFGYGKVLHKVYLEDNKKNELVFAMAITKTRDVVEIESRQSIVSKLLAEKVKLLIEIEMGACLIGNIVVNYAYRYGNHHLWSPDIGDIMKAAQLNNEITSKLLLEIKYYTNARLKLLDRDTGKEIK